MQVQLYSPTPKQFEVHQALDDEKLKVVTLVTGRQFGKSTLITNQAVKWCLEQKNIVVMIVSPSEQQAIKLLKDTKKLLENTKLIKSSIASKGTLQIEFFTGSIILYKSALATDSLRGNSVHYLIIDEAAYISEITFNEIILPTTSTVGRKIFLCSTPRGKKNILYKYYQLGRTDLVKRKKSFKSFKFTYKDNILANKELIQIFKESLNEDQFKQEFEAEFIDAASVFKNVNDICTRKRPNIGYILPENIKKLIGNCVIGVDIGLKNDRTVISIMSLEGDYQVDIIAHRYLNSNSIKQAIKETILKYQATKCVIEVNGLGLPIYQDLKEDVEVGHLVDEFYTTNENKNELVNELIHLINKQKITLINDEDLKSELEAFSFEFLPSGKIRFAAVGTKKDDMVMSTLISLHAKNKYKNSGYHIY